MTTYVSCITAKSNTGEPLVFSAAGATIGSAIREAAIKINTAVAGSGGYTGDLEDIRMVTAVYPIRDGIEQVRHEVEGETLTMFEMNGEEKGDPIAPVLVMLLNPLKAVDGQFIV